MMKKMRHRGKRTEDRMKKTEYKEKAKNVELEV